jgi:hypothetical protein
MFLSLNNAVAVSVAMLLVALCGDPSCEEIRRNPGSGHNHVGAPPAVAGSSSPSLSWHRKASLPSKQRCATCCRELNLALGSSLATIRLTPAVGITNVFLGRISNRHFRARLSVGAHAIRAFDIRLRPKISWLGLSISCVRQHVFGFIP